MSMAMSMAMAMAMATTMRFVLTVMIQESLKDYPWCH
jgi:hypothetical protein